MTESIPRPSQSSAATASGQPQIGVALGSGAARGLTQIPYIEAMDELGLRPAAIAGTSIGALIGAGWANGMTGREIREHATSVLGNLQVIAGRLWTSRPTWKGMIESGVSVQVNALHIARAFLPDPFTDDFTGLKVPFKAVATDLLAWEAVVFDSGPLVPAIAASFAIPALFRPVTFGGRWFIDGGTSNPLPLDCVLGADILIGIDVNGQPDAGAAREPSIIDTGILATRIMTRALIKDMVRRCPPDVYVEPELTSVGTFEFWRVREIIAAADAGKDGFKRTLGDRIEAWQRGQVRN